MTDQYAVAYDTNNPKVPMVLGHFKDPIECLGLKRKLEDEGRPNVRIQVRQVTPYQDWNPDDEVQ